jgi:hypothetical protein
MDNDLWYVIDKDGESVSLGTQKQCRERADQLNNLVRIKNRHLLSGHPDYDLSQFNIQSKTDYEKVREGVAGTRRFARALSAGRASSDDAEQAN